MPKAWLCQRHGYAKGVRVFEVGSRKWEVGSGKSEVGNADDQFFLTGPMAFKKLVPSNSMRGSVISTSSSNS